MKFQISAFQLFCGHSSVQSKPALSSVRSCVSNPIAFLFLSSFFMFALLFIKYTENFASWFVLTYFTALLDYFVQHVVFFFYLLLFISFTIYYLFFRNQIELFSRFFSQFFYVFSVVCHFVLPLLQRAGDDSRNLPLNFVCFYGSVCVCLWKSKSSLWQRGFNERLIWFKDFWRFLFVFGKKGLTSISVWYVGGIMISCFILFLRVEKLHYLPTCFAICIFVLLSLEIVWYN